MSYLVVGLGNPGKEYESTRHNIGRMVLDKLSGDVSWEGNTGAQALFAKIKIGKHSVLLLKPQTFMNKSGNAVLYAKKQYKTKPESIIVVHDDVDLPFGTLKIAFGRGSGGHRGVESIIKALGTKEFIRVRVGVVPTTTSGELKKPRGAQLVVDHVLGVFAKREADGLEYVIERAARAVRAVIEHGRERAMNEFNADVSVGITTHRRRG